MYRCMAAVVVRATNMAVYGQSRAITLCSYQIMLVDVLTRPTEGGTLCEASCTLFAYKRDPQAKARKPLSVSLLDDAGYRVPPGPHNWVLTRSSSHHQQTPTRTVVLTDRDGHATFSLFVDRNSVFEISGGFRLYVACDWQTCNELYPSISTTSRRFESTTTWGAQPALSTTLPSAFPVPLPPQPFLVYPNTAQQEQTPVQRPDQTDDLAVLTAEQLRHLGWAPVTKDGLLQCVCCRAVRTNSPLDVITHRPNCTLHNQLTAATRRGAKSLTNT